MGELFCNNVVTKLQLKPKIVAVYYRVYDFYKGKMYVNEPQARGREMEVYCGVVLKCK
jgi:hypothetical protein